jgi:flagellar motility protein MotE (MotC chaperone)
VEFIVTKESKPTPSPAPAPAAQAVAAQPADAQKSKAAGKLKGFLPYILYGVGGLALVSLIAFGTLFFLKGKGTDKSADSTGTQAQAQTEPDSAKSSAEAEDSLLALADLGLNSDTGEAIDNMIKNIEAMDVKSDGMAAVDSAADSAKEASWLDKEKETLAKRQSDLDVRQKHVEDLEAQVSQKLQKLEQASNDRVTNLAKLYDGMDASAVAKLMENLEDSIVVTIIPRMKQKNASQVLQMIPPQRAAKLSRQIITLAGD